MTNVSGVSFSATNNTDGAEVLSAALAKRQQQVEGQAAIALIEATAQTMQSLASPNMPTATLGNNINTYV